MSMKIYHTENYNCQRTYKNNTIYSQVISTPFNFKSKVNTDMFIKQAGPVQTLEPSKQISIVGRNYKDKIKIVFSDIDKTLSLKDDLMSEKTIDAVNLLHEKNIPLILTTARCYKDTLPISKQFRYNPEYTIALQGGTILDKNGIPIIESSISPDNGKKLEKWFKQNFAQDKNSHLIMYFDDEAYSLSNIQFPWQSRSLIKQTASFSDLFKNKKLQKAILFKTRADKNDDVLIAEAFRKTNIDELNMTESGIGFYEFQNKNVSKEKAIKFILQAAKIEPENAMVIGDSANDTGMLDFIKNQNGLAIAMGNAKSYIKQHANAVTSSIYKDGFAEAVNEIV